MDFGLSERAQDRPRRLQDLVDSHVHPAEPLHAEQRRELRAAGREHTLAHGLPVTDHAPPAKITDRSPGLSDEVHVRPVARAELGGYLGR